MARCHCPVTEFETPDSSLILSASYDEGTMTATVVLKDSKNMGVEKVYDYALPPDLWNEWVQATSKGAFFNKAIRPMYQGRLRT